ncbi:questin oxidase family protein [Kitasatospora sp. NPDC018058]|uniref:questin oxidase family protein n=1 Tax=Kitasatospora sp. NPDC018058 TaxID=3364025 RepID=UPI0037BFB473
MNELDGALEFLDDSGPEFGPGVSNHGPMASEALAQLGHADAIASWVSSYRKLLYQDTFGHLDTITEDNWRPALGNMRLMGDWAEFFRRELAGAPWTDVLARWWPRLLPGFSAGGGHGVIRTGHAVRMLSEAHTPWRLEELARGLGYWAARYQELPESPTTPHDRDLAQAWAAVPKLRSDQGDGMIFRIRLEALWLEPDFAPAVDSLRPDGDPGQALSRLTRTTATSYLTDDHNRPMAFVHALTTPAAVRLVLPHLPAELHWPSVAAAVRFSAAIRCAYGTGRREHQPHEPVQDYATLAERALASEDPHAIKYVEACRREDALSPDPVYGVAATHWVWLCETQSY